MHSVVELMRQRKLSESQPLARQDDARLALVLEGGSSRAAFGGGMVGALEEAGLLSVFDAVYGASAGALNGAWLLCERANANIHGWWSPESMKSTIKLTNIFKKLPVVNGDYLVDEVYENFTPMGFDEILASDIEYHPVATDADSGASTDLAPLIKDRATLKQAMKATTRVPLLSGAPVSLGGHRFIDGGMAENVPVETALAQGATHLLVLRTKAPSLDLPTTAGLKQKAVARWIHRNAPGAAHTWDNRNVKKQQLELLMARDLRVLQVAPPANVAKISMVGSDLKVLREAVEVGRRCMAETLRPVLGG